MERVVAIELTTDSGERCYVLTWGRIQDPVDPDPVAALVLAQSEWFATPGKPVSARVCDTLQEAASAPWFYEYFFDFCQERVPVGKKYEKWRRRIDKRMRNGKEMAFAGPLREYPKYDGGTSA